MSKHKPEKSAAHRGPCFKKDCQLNGGTIHTCITCEKLAAEAMSRGDVGGALIPDEHEVFVIQCCRVHYDEGLKRVKRHALTAHPVNLLRVMAAGLKGEKI
jgi:hypothetical protein